MEGMEVASESLQWAQHMAPAIAIGFGGLGPAVAIGILVGKALESIGRNPESASKIQPVMILGLAFAEAIAIYALVVALLLHFR